MPKRCIELLWIDTLGGGVLANPQPFSNLPSWCVTGWKPWPRNFLRRLFGGLRSCLAQRRAGFRRQVRDCLFRFRRSSCFLNVLLGRNALSRCSHRSLSLSFTVIFRSDTLLASKSVSDPWQVTPIVFVFLFWNTSYQIGWRWFIGFVAGPSFSPKHAKTSMSSANFILLPRICREFSLWIGHHPENARCSKLTASPLWSTR
jgi:hypothetical protein